MIDQDKFNDWFYMNPWRAVDHVRAIKSLTGADISLTSELDVWHLCNALNENRPDLTLRDFEDYMAARAELENWAKV